MDINGLIEGHFSDELSADDERTLRDALRQSPEHRRRYDERAELLRHLAEAEFPRRERAALWARIESDLDAPAPARVAKNLPRGARGWLSWASAFVAVALIAGVVALVWRHGPPQPDRTLKGGGASKVPSLTPGRVAFEIYAIRQGGDGHFATPRRVPDRGRLTLRDFIQFRYSSAVASFRHLYVAAIRAPAGVSAIAGESRLYYPRPGHEAPLRVTLSATMQTVGRSIRLRAHHRPGTLVVVAIFAEKAQDRVVVEAALGRLARGEAGVSEAWKGKVAFVRQRYRLVPGFSSGAAGSLGRRRSPQDQVKGKHQVEGASKTKDERTK